MEPLHFPFAKRIFRTSHFALPAALLLALVPPASAADATFTGTGAGADWLSPANWSTGAVPTGADTATITADHDALLTGGVGSVNVLNIDGNSNLTVSGAGSVLNLADTMTVGVLGSGSLAISGGAAVLMERSMNIAAGTGATGGVTVSGAGSSLIFDSFQMYLGSGTNSVATLRVEGGLLDWTSKGTSNSSLVLAVGEGSVASVVQVGGTVSMAAMYLGEGTATYRLEGGVLSPGDISKLFPSSEGSISFEFAGGTVRSQDGRLSSVFSASLLEGTTTTFDNNPSAGTFTPASWGGAISGSGALNFIGSGTFVLSGSNTYSGGTTLNEGTLSLQNNDALGSGALSINGNATIGGPATIANNIVIGSGFALSTSSLTNLKLMGNISGDGSLIVDGFGALTLGGNNTYSGGTYVRSGVITFSSGSNFGTQPITMEGGGLAWAAGATEDISAKVRLQSGISSFNTGGNEVNFATSLAGAGGLAKAGLGTLTLSASNSYTGNTVLSGGILRIAHTDAIVNSGTLVFSGGGIEGDGVARTISNELVFAGSGTFSGSSDLNFSGNGDLSGGTRNVVVTNTGITTFSGLLSGTGVGGFNKSGAGTLVVSGTDNTYTGRSIVSSGTLVVTALANLGTKSSLGAPVTVANGVIGIGQISNTGALKYVGDGDSTNRTINLAGSTGGAIIDASGSGALVLTGSITAANGSKTLALTGTNTDINTISGTIGNGGNGLVSLEKRGSGTWELSANNTYAGTTTISGGLLRASNVSGASNNLGIGTGAVILGGVTTSGTLAYTGNSATYTRGFVVNEGGGGLHIANAGQTLTLATNGVSTAGRFIVSGPGDAAIESEISGTGSLQKSGDGRLTLSGSNSFGGGTLVTGGTLSVQNNHALGTGAVEVDNGVFSVELGASVANDIVLSGGRYDRTLTGSLADAVNASSDLGGVNTEARIAAGELGSVSTLVTSFSTESSASNDMIRRSDVYAFAGTGSDIFVLELSFTSTEDGSYLGWLNGNQWVNAVDGNTGNNAAPGMLNYNGSFAEFQVEFGDTLGDYIGAYGTSISGGVTTSWAVLNHNSDFSVIPEPGTIGLLVMGAAVVLLRRRSR